MSRAVLPDPGRAASVVAAGGDRGAVGRVAALLDVGRAASGRRSVIEAAVSRDFLAERPGEAVHPNSEGVAVLRRPEVGAA